MGRSMNDSRKNSAAAAKLRQLGLIRGGSPTAPKPQKLQFRLYFPRQPYQGAEYTAAKGRDGLYNFVGLVLGHHGSTIQRLQRGSGAKIEIHGKGGNLNGDHPALGDLSLHALVQADSKDRLEKALQLLVEVLQPTNTTHKPFPVVAGGSAVLAPVPLPGWEAAAAAAAEAEAAREQEADGSTGQHGQQAALAPNAWLDRLRTRQRDPAPAPSAQSVLSVWPSGESQEACSPSSPTCSPTASEGSFCQLEVSGCSASSPSSWGAVACGEQSTVEQRAGSGVEGCCGEAPPKVFSLWDSGGEPSLCDHLQSVVQEHLLLQGGASPFSPPTCQFQEAVSGGKQELQPGLLAPPFPACGWALGYSQPAKAQTCAQGSGPGPMVPGQSWGMW